MDTEQPNEAADQARAEAAARQERERRVDLHRDGARLITEIDPDAGEADELIYRSRRYPFKGEEVVEIGQHTDRASGVSRVTFTVIDADGRNRGTAEVALHPERSPDLELGGLTDGDLADLEQATRKLMPRDVLPESG